MARTNDENEQRASEQDAPLSYLITEQDVHAFVDGELSAARRAAVAAFLAERAMTAKQAAAYLRSTFDLRAVKDRLYADDALRRDVERLLAKRERRTAPEEDEPARYAALF